MSNMTTFETGNPMLYDCVWLIKPLLHESAIRTHLQLLFEQFSSLGKSVLKMSMLNSICKCLIICRTWNIHRDPSGNDFLVTFSRNSVQ